MPKIEKGAVAAYELAVKKVNLSNENNAHL
jgi:hypothetical protein